MSRDSAPEETPDMLDLMEELEDLAEAVDDPEACDQVEETMDVARRMGTAGTFGRVIRGYDRADAAEALVGSVVFGIPMIIEGGTLEVGAFIATRPLYYLGTLLFGIGLTTGVLYVAEIQHVEIHRPFLGVVPRRIVGVLSIAFLTALALMTAWGRAEWSRPAVGFAQVLVVFVGMALGAALGDILPGS